MIISGSGEMNNWNEINLSPFNGPRKLIYNIKIIEGITSIGNYAFKDYSSLITITIPSSVKSIKENSTII